MAERRMLSKKIIDADAFMDMPLSTQALYLHLSIRADDDGFIGNPKKIARMIGANDDDYKVLLAKRFILQFPNGICVIKHWLIHNYIQNDRYKETQYLDEKKLLKIKDNKSYTECIQNGYSLETQVRLGKVRKDKKDTLQEIVPNGTDDVEIIPEEKPKTPKKKDYKKYDDETPFTLSEFVSSMEASPQRHVKIIGMYADTKQIKNSTKGQWRLFTDRNLASARRLSPYSDEQIARAFNEIEKNMKGSDNKKGYITRWTLETIEKYLEEI